MPTESRRGGESAKSGSARRGAPAKASGSRPGARPGARPPRPAPRVDPARRLAYDVVHAVSDRNAYANLVLPAALSEAQESGLADRDAAFATELAYGTLRATGTYDAILGACLSRPLSEVDAPVLDVLRLGAHQVLGMRVPAHAAVGSTVDLGRAALGKTGEATAGLVNAVLRKVTRQDLPAWVDEIGPSRETDLHGHLALLHVHPRWIVEALGDVLPDVAELEAALAANNVPAPVTLAARPGGARIEELLDAGGTRGRFSPYAVVMRSGNPASLPAVRQARAAVQDEGSQLVALALAAAPVDDDAGRWLDLCAGPGGKAVLLAGLLSLRGDGRESETDGARALAGEGTAPLASADADDASSSAAASRSGRGVAPGVLVANELQHHRAALVTSALRRSPSVVLTGDGRKPAWRPGTFDRVLVDAPCSGLGALRRRPEARWRRTPADVTDLAALQRALLSSAMDSARPGGVVAYVTCSPHRAETRVVVDDVLAERVDGELIDARPYFPSAGGEDPDWGDGPDVQLWPHRHGTDAMYLALMRRR